LHDIGMQTGWKEWLEIKGARGNISPGERAKVRKSHAETTGREIRAFKNRLPAWLNDRLNNRQKAIVARDLNEALAFICECHNKPDIGRRIKENIPDLFPNTTLKIGAIAAMLQLCDGLHMDKSRLNETQFLDSLDQWRRGKILEADYGPEDWRRYFQCYFIEKVSIRPVFGSIFQIIVEYRFNKNENKEIQEKFLNIYAKRLGKRRDDCVTVLNRELDIHFLNDDPFKRMEPDS
ncbi:MAG: hypothetical protein GY859_16565, partial [Desulfobacterales bacterium]|nr:hypothetical protein [Desulfobacterales bacterium]